LSPSRARASGAPRGDRRFADVAVDVPITPGAAHRRTAGARLGEADVGVPDFLQAPSDTFSYAIPERLQDTVRPGHGVWVPFGRRRVAGIVVALQRHAPVDRTRPISALIDERPLLDPAAIALARWMSAHYLAPFFECLATMLPPGGMPKEVREYARTDVRLAAIEATGDPGDRGDPGGPGGPRESAETLAGTGTGRGAGPGTPRGPASGRHQSAGQISGPVSGADLDDAERAVLSVFADLDTLSEEATVRRVRPRVAARAARKALASLVERGLLESRLRLVRPRVSAKRIRVAVLREHPGAGASSETNDRRDEPQHESSIDRAGPAGDERPAPSGAQIAALAYLAANGGAAPVAELRREAGATPTVLRHLESAGRVAVELRRDWRNPLADAPPPAYPAPAPTADQERAWSVIEPLLGRAAYIGAGASLPLSHRRRPAAALLHGVTGSGKTEVYLRAMARVLEQGRQAIALVPEIALTAQTVQRFAGRFPGRVGLWHSQMSDGERFDTWQRARAGELDVIVGSRSAVFAPLPRLGLIVIDEEHAEAYKQDRSPRYHARSAALQRAAMTGAVVLLGSATPSVESYWEAKRGAWRLAELPGRISGREMPDVTVVDMRAELRAGNTSMFSRELRSALETSLERDQQAILFLNRRGSGASFLCRDCGEAVSCPRCETPLAHHTASGRLLVCHRCNHREVAPMLCPACGSARIKPFGAGTERVEQAVCDTFPGARTLRWDADTTGKKGSHAALLARFVAGEANVLVGTQMITKGLDLPLVTLVGVVSADTALHFPDFRTAERAFQLLSQVAGRAGRSELGGRVIVQTYHPAHPAVTHAARHDFEGFYGREIAFRAAHRYPPWRRLARLELRTRSREEAAERARAEVARLGLADVEIIGPAPAFFRRERGYDRWQIAVLSPEPHALLARVPLPPGWRVDIDAMSLL